MTANKPGEFVIILLKYLLEEKKVYLEKELSVDDISKSIGSNPRQLPQIVKKEFGFGINRLINQYRIRHAIDLIEKGYLKKLTVESLAIEVGFRSRNTFYLAFKKETGLSPSDFVDSVIEFEWTEVFKN